MKFIYDSVTKAKMDAVRFSNMYGNDSIPIYVHVESEGWSVSQGQTDRKANIIAIAVNGELFTYSS